MKNPLRPILNWMELETAIAIDTKANLVDRRLERTYTYLPNK